MIGVYCKPEQRSVVEEFFELFKTPWEYYDRARTYDVVLSTIDAVPEARAKLLILFGADSKSTDASDGIGTGQVQKGGFVRHEGIELRIYEEVAMLSGGRGAVPLIHTANGSAGLRFSRPEGSAFVRLGYDLFQEVYTLLKTGQPTEYAGIPTLDLHVVMLRNLILAEGISFLEIPPIPAGHGFTVCLTHDIDFVGIRRHKFDHSMWGFVYRSTVGAVRNLLRGRLSLGRLFETWSAVAKLPFVFLGWAKDFWEPFEWFLEVENGLPATYFLIPFKGRQGDKVAGKHASRRASPYAACDISNWVKTLQHEGCEVGVHGIDAWHSVEKGREELSALRQVTNKPVSGIRMHWLLQDGTTSRVLERAGYGYDSTSGYNETIGYRNGTTQVFRPLDVDALFELPMHIQDGALFFHNRLDLSEAEAERRCKDLIEKSGELGGVLTVLWHDRSHGPERFWGDFYLSLVQVLRSSDAWFARGDQAVQWFRKRREVRFERCSGSSGVRILPCDQVKDGLPALCLRIHQPASERDAQTNGETSHAFSDRAWDADATVVFDWTAPSSSDQTTGKSVLEFCQ